MKNAKSIPFYIVMCMLLLAPVQIYAATLVPVTFYTSWFALAEDGGFYEAVADGIYKKYGLNVTIKQGGPEVNGQQLLVAGRCQFYMGSPIDAIEAAAHGMPVVIVATSFQVDPISVITHRNINSLYDLKKDDTELLVSMNEMETYLPWLERKYGVRKEQVGPYTGDVAPFLADKNIAQQGFITDEPYDIFLAEKRWPRVFLLAHYGYPDYAYTIETTRRMISNRPKIVSAFVKATLLGWAAYFKNPAPANRLIQKANPKETSARIKYAIETMRKYNLVSGEKGSTARTEGIGVMTSTRWHKIFIMMVKDGDPVPPNFDYKKVYDLSFVKRDHIFIGK